MMMMILKRDISPVVLVAHERKEHKQHTHTPSAGRPDSRMSLAIGDSRAIDLDQQISTLDCSSLQLRCRPQWQMKTSLFSSLYYSGKPAESEGNNRLS